MDEKVTTRIRTVASIGFLSCIAIGEPAFYAFIIPMLGFFITRPSAYIPLLFFSGLLKNAPIINNLPLDFTLMTFALSIFFAVVHFSRGHQSYRNLRTLLVLLALSFIIVIASIFKTPAPWTYISQSGIFILIMYLPLVTVILLMRPEARQRVIAELHRVGLVLCYLWIGLGLHNQFIGYRPPQFGNPEYAVHHISAFGEDYMTFSAFVGFVLFDLLIRMLFLRKYGLNFLFLLLVVFALINSPARGLTLGMSAGALILFLVWLRRVSLKKILIITFLSLACIAVVAIYVLNYATEDQLYAVQRLLDFDPAGSSTSLRVRSVRVGFSNWIEQPLFGTGVDSVAYFNGNLGYYTHNLILEILFEYGVIGGLPILILLIFSIVGGYANFRRSVMMQDYLGYWLTAIFITFLVFGMFSGTLGNIRQLWILIGLMLGVGFLSKKKSSENDASAEHNLRTANA